MRPNIRSATLPIEQKHSYAARVQTYTMSPVIKRGDVVLVDPNRAARCGDYVVVQLMDGDVFIAQLGRRTKNTVICEQFHPANATTYAVARVAAMHVVTHADWTEREL